MTNEADVAEAQTTSEAPSEVLDQTGFHKALSARTVERDNAARERDEARQEAEQLRERLREATTPAEKVEASPFDKPDSTDAATDEAQAADETVDVDDDEPAPTWASVMSESVQPPTPRRNNPMRQWSPPPTEDSEFTRNKLDRLMGKPSRVGNDW